MKQVVIYTICMGALLSSCNIYKKYNRPDVDVEGLYRDPVSVNDTLVSDTTNMGNLPWEEVFTDPQLQKLIRQGLEQNSDLQTAILKVKEAEAGLMSSRLAYLPSLGLSPQGTVSSFDKGAATQIYSLPVVSSWELDLFRQINKCQTRSKSDLITKRGIQASRSDTSHLDYCQHLLHAAHAGQATGHHGRDSRIMAKKRGNHESDERGRDGKRGRYRAK